MFYLILLLFLLLFVKIIVVNKVKIKWSTFFKKGITLDKNVFGIYCFEGKQGEGKTTGLVSYLARECKGKRIYSNLTLKGIKYTPINGFADLLELKDEKDCIIVFDEIFTALSKKSNKSVDWDNLLPFLSQMRKRGIIMLTTAQEWLEIDLTFRRYCRYQIECHSFNVPFFKVGILKKTIKDVDNMILDKDLMEYVAPPIATTYEKYNKCIVDMFDTYEVIKVYNHKTNKK